MTLKDKIDELFWYAGYYDFKIEKITDNHYRLDDRLDIHPKKQTYYFFLNKKLGRGTYSSIGKLLAKNSFKKNKQLL